jgi:hydroxymethylglutaryl-CoA lyase
LYETLGIKHVALSDTIGCATPEQLELVFNAVKNALPDLEIGVHLHAAPNKAENLIEAGISAGCKSFDSAILGIGGCPMAKDELTGNLATETLLQFCVNAGIDTGLDLKAFKEAQEYAATLFNQYH